MTINHNRRHQRLKHRASIKLFAAPNIEMTLDMRDFSDSGLYVFCSDTSFIKLDDLVEVQTLEMNDAPILKAIVKRLEVNTGFAVEFIL